MPPVAPAIPPGAAAAAAAGGPPPGAAADTHPQTRSMSLQPGQSASSMEGSPRPQFDTSTSSRRHPFADLDMLMPTPTPRGTARSPGASSAATAADATNQQLSGPDPALLPNSTSQPAAATVAAAAASITSRESHPPLHHGRRAPLQRSAAVQPASTIPQHSASSPTASTREQGGDGQGPVGGPGRLPAVLQLRQEDDITWGSTRGGGGSGGVGSSSVGSGDSRNGCWVGGGGGTGCRPRSLPRSLRSLPQRSSVGASLCGGGNGGSSGAAGLQGFGRADPA